MELIYAGFEILPTNISQAIALSSLMEDELVHVWRNVIESIELGTSLPWKSYQMVVTEELLKIR